MFHLMESQQWVSLVVFLPGEATRSRASRGLLTGKLARRFVVHTKHGYGKR